MAIPGRRFRVAFSFSADYRAFIRQVAGLLAQRFGKDAILYDEFRPAEFASVRPAGHLRSLYCDQAELIVAVFSAGSEQEEWCGLNRNEIDELSRKRPSEEVMQTFGRPAEVRKGLALLGYRELPDLSPEEATTLILQRLALNTGQPKDHYTQFAPPPVTALENAIPHPLPSIQPFFGREDELRTIAAALYPASPSWGALLVGPGGTGKTSLAIRAASDASPGHFQKIAFVSLKARRLDATGHRDHSGFLLSGIGALFGELAQVLGLDDIRATAEDRRPRRVLDALFATRTLLILDQLESLTQSERDTLFAFVAELPRGCKAILASRVRIGPGEKELIVGPLSETAVLDTLAELATHHPPLARTTEAERRALFHTAGGQPLLVRWLAGQLGRGRCVTCGDALHFLRSVPPGRDPLALLFDDFVAGFSAEETRVLSALAYLTPAAKIEHLAPLAQLSEAAAQHILRSLTHRSLVLPSDHFRTFTLAASVAEFWVRTMPGGLVETGERLERMARALVDENGLEEYSRFPILSDAWPLVAAALPGFLAGESERLQGLCDALQCFLTYSDRWPEHLALLTRAEARAVAAEAFLDAGQRAVETGRVYYWRRDPHRTLACVDRAFAYWQKSGASIAQRHEALCLQIWAHGALEDRAACTAATKAARELSPTEVRIISWGPAAQPSYFQLEFRAQEAARNGDSFAAEIHYLEALRLARTSRDRPKMALYAASIAHSYLQRQDWRGAETLFRQALSLAERAGLLHLIASTSHSLTTALLRQGRKQEALPFARRAVILFLRLDAAEITTARAILRECEEALK